MDTATLHIRPDEKIARYRAFAMTQPNITTDLCDRKWSYTTVELPDYHLSKKYRYYFSFTSTHYWSRKIEENWYFSLVPELSEQQTIRHVFRFTEDRKTRNMGKLHFADLILRNVNESNLDASIHQLDLLYFPESIVSKSIQRDIEKWIQTRISGLVKTKPKLVFLAIAFGRLMMSSRENPSKTYISQKTAQVLLRAFQTYGQSPDSLPSADSKLIQCVAECLVKSSGGSLIDVIHYFFPLIKPHVLVLIGKKLPIRDISMEKWPDRKDSVVQLASYYEYDEKSVQEVLIYLLRRIQTKSIFSGFLQICVTHCGVLSPQIVHEHTRDSLVQEIVWKFQNIALKENLDTQIEVLHELCLLVHETEELALLLRKLFEMAFKILSSNMWVTHYKDALRFFILQPQLYQASDDLLVVVRRLLSQHHKDFPQLQTYFEVVRSEQIMRNLEDKKQADIFRLGLDFIATGNLPKGDESYRDSFIQKIYHLLEIVRTHDHFKKTSFETLDDLVYDRVRVLPLRMLGRQLKQSTGGSLSLNQYEQHFVANHIVRMIRSSTVTVAEVMWALMACWCLDEGIVIESKQHLDIWMTVVDMIPCASDSQATNSLSEDDLEHRVFPQLDVWMNILKAIGKYAMELMNHNKVKALCRQMDDFLSNLQLGNVTLAYFRFIIANEQKLQRLCTSLKQTRSWEDAFAKALEIHNEYDLTFNALVQFNVLLRHFAKEIYVENSTEFEDEMRKQRSQHKEGNILLSEINSVEYWGSSLYTFLPVAKSIHYFVGSAMFRNVCRSVLDGTCLEETAVSQMSSASPDLHDMSPNAKATNLVGFAHIIGEDCTKIFKMYCNSLFHGNMGIAVSKVDILLDGIKSTEALDQEILKLYVLFKKKNLDESMSQVLQRYVRLPELSCKSNQIQRVFDIFNVAQEATSVAALTMLQSVTDPTIQKTLTIEELDVSMLQILEVVERFTSDEWNILEPLSQSSELVEFLRTVVDDDLRNLIDAVEEHAEQTVNEAVVSDLIDVKRYLRPLLKRSVPIDMKDFTSDIKTHHKLQSQLPQKLMGCTTNSFSLKHLYDNVANRGQMTKEIIKNALENGIFKFSITDVSDRCNATMEYSRDDIQVSYNIEDMNDLRSRALLIVNSKKISQGTDEESHSIQTDLQAFINDITAVNKIVDTLNGLHESGHFNYKTVDMVLQRSDDLPHHTEKGIDLLHQTEKDLETRYNEWSNMLHDARDKHYFLSYFNAKYLWLLDEFLRGECLNPADQEKAETLIRYVYPSVQIERMQEKYKSKKSQGIQKCLDNLGKVLNLYLGQKPTKSKEFPSQVRPSYDITLATVVNPGRVFVAELDSRSANSIAVLLELFRNTCNCYPQADQVIFCHEGTSLEEITRLLMRCRGAKDNNQGNKLYSLVNVEALSTDCQFALVKAVKDLMKASNNFLLLLICRGGINHPIIDQFSSDLIHRVSGMTNGEMEKCLRSHWSQVEVITSDLPGMGKSEYIADKAISNDLGITNIHVSGPITKESLVKTFSQAKKSKLAKKSKQPLLHVDVGMVSNPYLFDTFMFELLVMGSVSGGTHMFALQSEMIVIEVANSPQNMLMDSLIVCSNFKRVNLKWQHFQNFLVSKELNSPVQTVCIYLQALADNTLDKKDIILAGEERNRPLPTDKCRLILKNFFDAPKQELSFSVVNTCLGILSDGLRRFSASQFFTVSTLEKIATDANRKHLRSSFVRALCDVAMEFSKRSTKYVSEKKSTMADFGHDGELSAEHMTKRVNEMIRWEKSNHLLLVFHQCDPQTLSVFYRDHRKVPPNIKQLFVDQMRKDLSDYNEMTQEDLHEILEKVCRSKKEPRDKTSLGEEKKGLNRNYALTPDNLLKMTLIHMRIRSRIPVIIMGETGCGKTSLITYLSRVCEIPFYVCNIHAGISADKILEFASKMIDEANKSVDKEIWGFFDEINTCSHLGLLNDIICHRRYQGAMLPDNLIFMAACNPYRLRGVAAKTAGLDGKLQFDEQSKLVYRVHPLPETMMDYVWDYGSLDRKDEVVYIRRMITGTCPTSTDEEQFGKLLARSQDFIREVEHSQYCVSLRDINRCKHLAEWFRGMLKKKTPASQMHATSKGESDETELRSQILALAHCYYSRLTLDKDRQTYLVQMSEVLEEYWDNMDKRYLEDHIQSEQKSMLNKMDLPNGTAKNLALRENIFVILVSILNKIPVFVVGKPGCSKSLSMQLIRSNLRGPDSKNKFFKNLPPVYVVSHQGSESSTSEGIEKVFKKAEKYKRHNTQICPVVLLDEIGLAEVSRFNPLKVLHSLLEPVDKDFPSIAVVGISNWALDAAKMNRAVYLSRPEPTIEDLHETAKAIRDDIEASKVPIISNEYLGNLASAYYQYHQEQRHKHFHGLRDYYSMVKYISATRDLQPNEINRRIKEGILRNFGGLQQTDIYMIVHQFTAKMPQATEVRKHSTLIERISENLQDKNARHLMIITTGDSALTILEQSLQDREYNVIFGSRFEDDSSEEYNYRILSKIILCMERGITLVLRDLDSIYGSLYDMLNQNYLIVGKKRNCRIALGAYSNPMCQVHEDFRCIVLVDERHIDYSDPPFLNRFEKQRLNFTDILDGRQIKAINKLKEWMSMVTSVEGTGFGAEDMFLGIHSDSLPSLVYFICKSDKYSNPDTDTIVDACKTYLMMVACPDAVFRSTRSALQKNLPMEVEKLYELYFKFPLHSGIRSFLWSYIGSANSSMELQFDTFKSGFKFIIYTNESIHTDVGPSLESLCKTQEEKLTQIKSEGQLSSCLGKFWFESEERLLLLHCQPSLDSAKMLHARCLIDQFRSEFLSKEDRKFKSKHVCLIVHVERCGTRSMMKQEEWSWQFNFLCGWNQVTLDTLSETRPFLDDLIGKPVTTIIEEGHIESTDLVKEQVLWGLTCLKYTFNSRSINDCLELANNIASSSDIMNCFKPHILKLIDESDNARTWQVDASCNVSLLYSCGTVVGAMLEYIKRCFRSPLGKILFFLESLSAWCGSPVFKKESDPKAEKFWIHCFSEDGVFDIKSTTIPEPRGIESCAIENKLLDLQFPLYRVFHEKISTHREWIMSEAEGLAVESKTTVDNNANITILVNHLAQVIQTTLPTLTYGDYLEKRTDIFFGDMCTVFATEHAIDVFETELKIMRWIFEQKLPQHDPTTANEAVSLVARWFVGVWIYENLIIATLKLLTTYINATGRSVEYLVECLEKTISNEKGNLPFQGEDAVEDSDSENENIQDQTRHDPANQPYEADKADQSDMDGPKEEPQEYLTKNLEANNAETNTAAKSTSVPLEDIIVSYVCKGMLPTATVLRDIDGIDSWQRKVGVIILLAGRVSQNPPILHFLRLCRDFTSVLSAYGIPKETIALLAEMEQNSDDPLGTDSVFDFVKKKVHDLQKKFTEREDKLTLEKFLCMYFMRAFESNPDTTVMSRIINSLTSEDGELIVGARSVLFFIIRTDVEVCTRKHGVSIENLCQLIISGDLSTYENDLPNIQLLDYVLSDQDSVDCHLATVCADILRDVLCSHITRDRLSQIITSDDCVLGTMTEAIKEISSADAPSVQFACSIAFVRAVLDAFADLIENSDQKRFTANGDLYLLAGELNSFLTIQPDASNAIKTYFLKQMRSTNSITLMKTKCDALVNPIDSFKDLRWQKELLFSRLGYSPMSYVEHYQDVVDAIAKYHKDVSTTEIAKVLQEAEENHTYRLALASVVADMFFFPRTTRPLKDTEKDLANWINGQISAMDTFHPFFKRLISYMLGKQDFLDHLNLGEGTSQMDVERVSVVIHLACVVASKASSQEKGTFLEFMQGSLQEETRLLPSIGHPSQYISKSLSVGIPDRTQCPACKLWIIYSNMDKRETRLSTTRFVCPICKDDSLREAVNTVKWSNIETEQFPDDKGYTTRSSKIDLCDPGLAIRLLSPFAYRIISIIFHSCLQIAVEMRWISADSLKTAVTLDSDRKPDGTNYYWVEVDTNWSALQHLLTCNSEHTALFLHEVIKQAGDVLTSTTQNCESIEQSFSEIVDSLVECVPTCQQEFLQISLTNIGSTVVDGLEQCLQELKPDELRDEFSKLLRQRKQVSFKHFEVSVLREIVCHRSQFELICLFLQWQKHLHLLQYIPDLLEWNRYVSNRLNQRVERKEANQPIEEFLTKDILSPTEDVRTKLRETFLKQFQHAWNEVRAAWKILTGQDAEFDMMGLRQPMRLCLIEGHQHPLQQMITVLQNIQNDFLHQALAISARHDNGTLAFLRRKDNVACLPSVPLVKARSEIISFSWKPYYLNFCDIDTNYAMGTVVRYDFLGIERELASVLVVNKAFLTSSADDLRTFSFSDELFHASSSILKEVKEVIEQEDLSEEIKKAIQRHHRKSQTFTKDMLDLLEVLILFLKKLGKESTTDPEMPMGEFINKWSALLPRAFPSKRLPKTKEQIKLCHIVGLYEALEDNMTDVAIAALHLDYQKPLEAKEVKVKEVCKEAKRDQLERATFAITRFIYRYLRSGQKTDPAASLVELMDQVAGTTLDCADVASLFPQELKIEVEYVAAVVKILKDEIQVNM